MKVWYHEINKEWYDENIDEYVEETRYYLFANETDSKWFSDNAWDWEQDAVDDGVIDIRIDLGSTSFYNNIPATFISEFSKEQQLQRFKDFVLEELD